MIRKRMRAKLQTIKLQLHKRMHDPVTQTGELQKGGPHQTAPPDRESSAERIGTSGEQKKGNENKKEITVTKE
jgi:hypothetical protein